MTVHVHLPFVSIAIEYHTQQLAVYFALFAEFGAYELRSG